MEIKEPYPLQYLMERECIARSLFGTRGRERISPWRVSLFCRQDRSFALAEIERLRQEGHEVYAAVASRCDETEYADICLKHLVIHGGKTLQECFQDRVQIDPYSDKTHHLQRLHEQTGIPFENMCFFDNEIWNIRCVSKLGVKSIYTPDGMTTEAWEEALSNFRLPS
mmetsp:Transcript_8251/g.19137  ORF Transcript_8251/g.19137 Transcript_8251/m.19137 type:complete len:168 (+) Transcript_8251:195-698(+)